MTVPSGIRLGEKYKDTITDFEGTAVKVDEYLNGCVTAHLVGKVDEKGRVYLHESDDIVLMDRSGDRVHHGESCAEDKLGKRYKDTISGFTGIAVARRWLLNGSIQLMLEGPLAPDGALGRMYCFDEDRLVHAQTGAPAAREPVGVGGPVVEFFRD